MVGKAQVCLIKNVCIHFFQLHENISHLQKKDDRCGDNGIPVIIINACNLVFRRLAQCGHTKPMWILLTKLSQTLKKKGGKEAERVAKAISNVLKTIQKQVSGGHGGHALQGDFFLLLADHHKVKGFVPSCMSVMMCHHKPKLTKPTYHGSKLPKV